MGLSDHPRAVFTGGSAHLYPPRPPQALKKQVPPSPSLVPSAEAGFELHTGTSEAPPPGFSPEVPTLAQPTPGSLRAPPPTFYVTHSHTHSGPVSHARTHTLLSRTLAHEQAMHTDTHPHTQGPGIREGVPSAEDELRREGSCLQLCLPSPHVLTPTPAATPRTGLCNFLEKKKTQNKQKISICAEGQRSACSRPPRGFVS